MGREFGHLMRMRHVITYSLSPFEQRAFPHYFSKGIPNMLRRTRARILRVAPRECSGRAGGWTLIHSGHCGFLTEHSTARHKIGRAHV